MQLLRSAAVFLATVAPAVAEPSNIASPNPGVDIDDSALKEMTQQQLIALHKMMDTAHSGNYDGKVSFSEMVQFHHDTKESSAHSDAQAIIQEIDADRDQMVSWGEMSNWLVRVVSPDKKDRIHEDRVKFNLADKNKDELLNSMEVVAYLFPETDKDTHKYDSHVTFKAWDKNKDGALSLAEYLAGDDHDPADIVVTHVEEKEFEILDFDKDGKLDEQEFGVHNGPWFQAEHNMKLIMSHADVDGDGFITTGELEGAYHLIRASHDAHAILHDAVDHHEL